MNQKTVYLSPQADVLDLSYADPVCQVVSAEVLDFFVDDYTPDWV